jgi:SAM-dependent methyltransferase
MSGRVEQRGGGSVDECGGYAYRDVGSSETRRLQAMERIWDPGTLLRLDRIGIYEGMEVAEVGAGAGSIALELARRVGPNGSVYATDLAPAGVGRDRLGVVSVHEHDIRAGELPRERFDFVHARLLVEHVGLAAIANLAAGLRPGGTLLVEDLDCGSRGWHPDEPDGFAVGEALLDVMSAHGYDRFCGRKLPTAFEDAGLGSVDADGHVKLIRSGTSQGEFFRLSILALRDRILAGGGVSAAQLDGYVARMQQPGLTMLSAIMVGCRGTRPR